MIDIKAIQDILAVKVDGNKLCSLCSTEIPTGGMCKCSQEALKIEEERISLFLKAEKERHHKLQVEVLRKNGIVDQKYIEYTFDADDLKNPKISETCKAYVAKWGKMRDNNYGLLFYGPVGTGKTFYAGCIANALIEMLVPVLVTSFSSIINSLQALNFGEDKNEVYKKLQEPDLLVLDDCGIERSTEYILEQMFLIIDARYKSNKPLIVTTNLTPTELSTRERAYARIYDRILECCIPIQVIGTSRRLDAFEQKQKQFSDLLGFNKQK